MFARAFLRLHERGPTAEAVAGDWASHATMLSLLRLPRAYVPLEAHIQACVQAQQAQLETHWPADRGAPFPVAADLRRNGQGGQADEEGLDTKAALKRQASEAADGQEEEEAPVRCKVPRTDTGDHSDTNDSSSGNRGSSEAGFLHYEYDDLLRIRDEAGAALPIPDIPYELRRGTPNPSPARQEGHRGGTRAGAHGPRRGANHSHGGASRTPHEHRRGAGRGAQSRGRGRFSGAE